MGKHVCHIAKCGKPTAPKLLMCLEHWTMVPLHLKTPVIVNFNPKQCSGPYAERVRPTNEWLKAARAAINHVEFKCGLRSILRADVTSDVGEV